MIETLNEMIFFVIAVIVMYMAGYGIVDRICKCFENCHDVEVDTDDKSRNKES